MAAYLLARRLDNREIRDLYEIETLKTAAIIMRQMRGTMTRGNVLEDNERDGESYFRWIAASRIVWHAYSEDSGNCIPLMVAASRMTGSGACSEHALDAAYRYLRHIKQGEAVVVVKHAAADHCWAEVRHKDRGRDSVCVIDGWCKDAPILAPDGSFTNGPASTYTDVAVFTYEHASSLLNDLEKVVTLLNRKYKKDLARHIHDAKSRTHTPVRIWSNTPVISSNFANTSSRNISNKLKTLPPLELELIVMNISQSRLGLSVNDSFAHAEEVINSAQFMEQMR